MDISSIFNLLQIPTELQTVPQGLSPADTVDHFRRMKETGRKNFRQLSLKHHPDKGGDPVIMRSLLQAWEEFQQVRPLPPQRQDMVIISFAAFQVIFNQTPFQTPSNAAGSGTTSTDDLPF